MSIAMYQLLKSNWFPKRLRLLGFSVERNGDGGGGGKRNGHSKEDDVPAAEAKLERKKSDLVKPTKEENTKPAAAEAEAEKVKKTSSSNAGDTKQPVPTARKGSTGAVPGKTVPNTPGSAPKTVPNTPGTATKTVPNTPTTAAKATGTNKEPEKKADGSGFYGFLKRA